MSEKYVGYGHDRGVPLNYENHHYVINDDPNLCVSVKTTLFDLNCTVCSKLVVL